MSMMTPIRTAQTTPCERTLDEMIADVNRLGRTEPVVTGEDRERLLLDHLDVKLRLERLELRQRLRMLDDGDHAELADCSRLIERLHTRWSRPPD